jgi:hypothetical protein
LKSRPCKSRSSTAPFLISLQALRLSSPLIGHIRGVLNTTVSFELDCKHPLEISHECTKNIALRCCVGASHYIKYDVLVELPGDSALCACHSDPALQSFRSGPVKAQTFLRLRFLWRRESPSANSDARTQHLSLSDV